MRFFAPALLLLLVGACGYHPPPQTDVSSPAYTADLKACQNTAASEVNQLNVKRFFTWISSPVRRWGQISDAVQVCMAGKGYRQ